MHIASAAHRNPAPETAAPGHPFALVIIATTTLLVVLDATIVNVTLPTIRRALGFGETGLEWVVASYTLAFGSLLLPGGRSGDIFGRRRMLAIGLTLFSLGALAAGLSAGPAGLIAARFVQGAGAAIAAPTALALIAAVYPAGPARNRAMGVYALMSSSGGALGLIVGGLLTQTGTWRAVFFIVVPVGLAAAICALRVLPETDTGRASLDLPGAVTATAGILALVFGLGRAAQGWATPSVLTSFAAAALLLAAFARIETHQPAPLLPGRILADRRRAVVYSITLIVGLALFAASVYLMLFLQQVLGYGSLRAGLAFLALAAPIALAAIASARLVGRIGPRPALVFGPLLAALGAFLLAQLMRPGATYSALAGPMALFGLGLGASFVPLTLTALATVEPHDAGVASALISASQQIGASIGVALLGTLAVSVAGETGAATDLSAGYGATFFATSALLVVAAMLAALALPRSRRPS